MPHQRGKRSLESRRKRVIRKILSNFCRYKRDEAELVTLKSFDYTVTARLEKYPWREISYTEFTEPGEVLVDSRGTGSFQR